MSATHHASGGGVEREGDVQSPKTITPPTLTTTPSRLFHSASTAHVSLVGNLEGSHNVARQFDKNYNGENYSGEVTSIAGTAVGMTAVTIVGFILCTIHGV